MKVVIYVSGGVVQEVQRIDCPDELEIEVHDYDDGASDIYPKRDKDGDPYTLGVW